METLDEMEKNTEDEMETTIQGLKLKVRGDGESNKRKIKLGLYKGS